MNHLIRLVLVSVIFITIFSITFLPKLIFCIWDWKWEFNSYFKTILEIAMDVVDLDS